MILRLLRNKFDLFFRPSIIVMQYMNEKVCNDCGHLATKNCSLCGRRYCMKCISLKCNVLSDNIFIFTCYLCDKSTYIKTLIPLCECGNESEYISIDHEFLCAAHKTLKSELIEYLICDYNECNRISLFLVDSYFKVCIIHIYNFNTVNISVLDYI
jgi:hypothetical protein